MKNEQNPNLCRTANKNLEIFAQSNAFSESKEITVLSNLLEQYLLYLVLFAECLPSIKPVSLECITNGSRYNDGLLSGG